MKTPFAVLVVALICVGAVVVAVMMRPGPTDEPSIVPAPEAKSPFDFDIVESPGAVVANDGYSNIHPADYLGPEKCVDCHSDQYQQWKGHSHARMNQNASSESVVGNFNDRRIAYGAGEVLFSKENDEFYMTLFEADELARKYRVTRTVGSRYTQMYIGLQTEGPEAADHHVFSMEGKLPFGYWIQREQWTPVTYFDSAYEPEPEAPEQQTEALYGQLQEIKWELNCLYCHNTYPYQHRVSFGHGTGFAPEHFKFTTEDAAKKWGLLKPDDLVTLGISCESCHFGGREHVENQKEARYYPTSPEMTLTTAPASVKDIKSDPKLMNSICTQCHCADVTCYPNGAATWNSREALDLKSGACQQQLHCTDCHDPHQGSDHGGLPTEARMIEKCLQCHTKFQDEKTWETHSHHAVNDASCLDCHMPRIVQGLAGVVRTHNISSPTDPRMFQVGAANACNLCHLDKSIEWTIDNLKQNHLIHIPINKGWKQVYKNLADPMGDNWLAHPQPIVRLIATDAFTRHGGRTGVTKLLPLLKDEYAVNRMFSLFAIEKLLGRKLTDGEYAALAPRGTRDAMVDRLEETLKGEAEPASSQQRGR